MKPLNFFIKHYKFLSFTIFLSFIAIPVFVFAALSGLPKYMLVGRNQLNPAFLPISSNNIDYALSGVCLNNTSSNDYLIPNKTYGEWFSFYNLVLTRPGTGVNGVTNKTCCNGFCNTAAGDNCNNCGACVGGSSCPFSLSYLSDLSGSITGASSQQVTSGSSGTIVTAVPNVGYSFDRWDDGSTSNPRQDKNVTSNITVTANYNADPCAWGMCADACNQNCGNGYTSPNGGGTGGGGGGGNCALAPCDCGFCDSQCGYYCPGGYWH